MPRESSPTTQEQLGTGHLLSETVYILTVYYAHTGVCRNLLTTFTFIIFCYMYVGYAQSCAHEQKATWPGIAPLAAHVRAGKNRQRPLCETEPKNRESRIATTSKH